MRLLALALSWLLLAATGQPPGSVDGRWEGALVREGATLPVSFDVHRDSEQRLVARFNSPTQRALGIPLRNVRFEGGQAHFELVGDATTIIFDGAVVGDEMRGAFREGSAVGSFALRRAPPYVPPYREEQVRIRNGDVTLEGTLLLPSGVRAPPVVVFLHGSGAESRAGSRFLADHLARNGIAALIYDKRGVGGSTGDWRTSDFQALAGDAIAAIDFLAARADVDGRRIGVYGHSQGGMIAPLIASRSPLVRYLISGGGSAVPLHQAEVDSITNQLRAQGIAGDELIEARRFVERFVGVLRTGSGWPEFEAETARVRGRRWYPMLRVPPRDNWFWAYYRAIADYDAALYWQRVRVPALLIYGERDNLVPVAPTIAAVDRALNRAGNVDYLILTLPRADHAFNIRPEPGEPFEWFRLAPGLPDLLVAWIHRQAGRAPTAP